MATLHLNLPDDLKARLQARAAESGCGSVEQYAEALLGADADESFVDDETEQLLARRLDDPRPDVPFTQDFRRGFREEVERRRTGRNP